MCIHKEDENGLLKSTPSVRLQLELFLVQINFIRIAKGSYLILRFMHVLKGVGFSAPDDLIMKFSFQGYVINCLDYNRNS